MSSCEFGQPPEVACLNCNRPRTGKGACPCKVTRLPSGFGEVKDSGKREVFDTGSRRDDRTGKGRYDLLCPRFIRRLAQHNENGAAKYGDRNWEKGQPQARMLDSAIRHLFNYLEGMEDEDHLAAAAWNIMAVISQEERIDDLPPELFDLPGRGG